LYLINIIFEELNPWWEKEKWEEADKHLRTWKNQKIRWLPTMERANIP